MSIPDTNSLARLTAFVVTVGVLAALLAAVFKRRGAAARETIWTSALSACLAASVSLAFAPRLFVHAPRILLEVSAATSLPATSVPRVHIALPILIVIVWGIGVLFFGLRLVRQLIAAAQLRHRAVPVTNRELLSTFSDARARFGLSSDVACLLSDDTDLPFATGMFRPAVILPRLSRDWDHEEARIVLLHELAHIQRRDLAGRCVALAACALNWYNPIVWWMSKRAYTDMELAADEAVMRTGVAGHAFAQVLLNVRDLIVGSPNVEPVMLFAQKSLLPMRINAAIGNVATTSVPQPIRTMAFICSFALAGALGCVRFAQVVEARSSTDPTIQGDWIVDASTGLTRLLSDPSPQVRGASVKALGRLGVRAARPSIEKMLGDPDKNVRYEARNALQEFNSK